mmetsp:Transcript_13905/g.20952  ORF Transcript_13905/g.20952 Transcript_13905/m.20952 type:complete len:237 (+) Transcript_13905:1481-2191(+)
MGIREDLFDVRQLRDGNHLEDILVELILILFDHTERLVRHITSVMLNTESITTHIEMRVIRALGKTLGKRLVSTFSLRVNRTTHIIKHTKHTRWTTAFNQFAHHLVVKVVDRCPLDTFALIFFLFKTQCKLNKDLLKLLVDIVDAKLLKTIFVKHLKSVNIKHTNDEVSFLHQRLVDTLHQPRKHLIVKRLGERITCCDGLHTIEGHLVGSTTTCTTTGLHGTLDECIGKKLWWHL